MRHSRSRGVKGFVERHRAAFTFLALFLMSSPARPDDRQLLQANSGANTNVLLILDSSYSMNNEFSDSYRMPAFLDDFIYPEGTTTASGSKFAIAKSVLRQVMTNTAGVNWAFSYYRNPDQRFGAADTSANANAGDPPIGYPVGGAKTAGQHLENGGLEWLYFADTLDNGDPISGIYSAASYPDVQQGRFLQLGHKVMRLYGTLGTPEVPPYTVNPTNPDPRPPYPSGSIIPGGWRGAFGPHGLNEGLVIYRSPSMANHELRLQVVSGNYSDPFIIVEVDEYGPPNTATPTPTNTPTQTNTPSNTQTRTASRTPSSTNTRTPSNTASPTRTATFTGSATATATRTPTMTSTASATATPSNTFTPSQTNTASPTNTPSNTNTPSATATRTFTASSTATFTATNTPSQTSTASRTPSNTATNTPTRTNTPSKTATRTFTFTPSQTFTPSPTFTRTFTATATFTATRTFTPSSTNTPSRTNTPSNTASRTPTFTATNTPTNTNTPSRTPSNTPTNTASRTFTPSNTATRTPSFTATQTFTATSTATATFTPSNTASATPTNTATRTFTPSNTASATATNTATSTPSNTPSSTRTPSNTPSRTATRTATATFTRTATPTGTPPPTPTFTPTLVPTLPGGAMPGKSLLPAIANWLSPIVRGLFAMPPYSYTTAGPCPGIPSSYTNSGQLQCAPCPYDATRLCAFVDNNANGIIDAGDNAPAVLKPLPSSPVFMRGFDDPQADPDPTMILVQSVRIKYVRGDLYNLPPAYSSNDSSNGNPPWGSCPSTSAGCPTSPDNDADGQSDTVSTPDRHNQGAYSAIYDKERPRPVGQFPSDALAGPSCPLGIVGCDPYSQDCGGFAHFNTFKGFSGAAPTALGPSDTTFPAVYPSAPPSSATNWPVVPFKREWLGTDYPGGNSPEQSIKRLLRFSSALVSYDSAAGPDTAYTLQEDAKEVVVTTSCTPIAGVLKDAYDYFTKSVFPPADPLGPYPWPTGEPGPQPAMDPSIDCRNYIIVYVTDGHDEAGSDPCSGGSLGTGPAGDLGQVPLPESSTGRRTTANGADPSVRIKGIPVYVVGLNTNPTFFPALNCIATNSGGQLFAATDRTTLQAALESILDFKRSANFFAAPSVPAFSGGVGDTAQIGSVVPSHLNPNGELSSWSVWSGSIKSFQLDTNGQIPVVTGSASTPTPTDTPGGPTATPVAATPTPTAVPAPGTGTFPDETNPDDSNPSLRKPVWSAGRVLGYTDPKADLTAGAAAAAASPSGRAPAISVWPGRKMVFASGSGIPLTRETFMPNSGGCTGFAAGNCFGKLMIDMGLDNTSSADQTRAVLTVQFLRGGASTFGSRDEILNDPSIRPATIGTIGPNTGQEQKFSYFYQDDQPPPIPGPQVRTDDDGTPPAGYAHKLGDIFHSEPLMLEPPRYFQYLSANLTPRTGASTFGEPYLTFAQRQAKRRKVLFAGSNDGFLHAFDGAVFGRDTTNFPTAFDLGTGREIFAYAPRPAMGTKMPSLLNFPPLPQYFVDGSMASADVFIDPTFAGSPTAGDRVWRTVLVGGLRQGGAGYYALDVTQPDDIDTNTASPTFGEITGNKDASPGCLNGAGVSCSAGSVANRAYPTIMWEFTDAGSACSDGCSTVSPALGETWSRPVVGRIKVYDPSSPTADTSGFDDRYVAIFGGGFDPSFTPGDRVLQKLPKGRAIYIVDVETGNILFKTTEGSTPDGSGGFNAVPFAPMPAPPAVADYNDDGYLDVVYIGDVNGNMWRMSLTPDVANGVGLISGGQAHGYSPYLLFNGCGTTADVVCTNLQPIFYEPGIVYLGGSANPPGLGIAFGTGNRADLARPNTQTQSFYYVVDNGQISQTFVRSDLHDLSSGGAACPLPYDPVACAGAVNGFVLDYGNNNEKTTSTVFSTQGYLSLITFTPDSTSPCATDGVSYRYRFFFLTGQGGYGTTGTMSDYREKVSDHMAAASQSTSPQGDTIDTILFGTGAIRQEDTPGSVHSIEQNWKEQQ